MFSLMNQLTNGTIVKDTETLIAHVETEPDADASRIGCVGYCMSGPFALAAAAGHSDRIQCAASIYGVRLAVDADDSPHHGFGDTQGEIYIAAAEHDDYAPPAMIELVEAALAESGANGPRRVVSRNPPRIRLPDAWRRIRQAPPRSGTGRACTACSTET